MLVARGETTVGEGSLRWTVLFGAKLWASIIERRRLVYDTRFVPASSAPPSDRPSLYLLIEGEILEGASRVAVAPCALLVSDTHLDGANGQRPWCYRAPGEPFRLIELHLDPRETSLRPAARPAPLPLDRATWDAARRLYAARDEDGNIAHALTDLTHALHAQSLVTQELVESTRRQAPTPFQVLWRGVAPIIARLHLRSTMSELSALTGTSSREVDRLVRAFVTSFGLVGDGWRDISRFWRLKLATLFLTADGATLADIARAVGYGSSDAMGRAFRDAGLPAPSIAQAEMHHAHCTHPSPLVSS
jgi:AraC-like DNA-binding protein